MARFVSMYSYTAETWQRMQANPGDRPAAIGAVVEQLGGKVLSMHFVLGPYDGLLITELPDAAAAAALSTVATSTGAFAGVETHALLAPDDLPRMLELSRDAAANFVAPGR